MGELITNLILSALGEVLGRPLAPYFPGVMKVIVRGGMILILVMSIYIVARWLMS
jgi:hypothetical protein